MVVALERTSKILHFTHNRIEPPTLGEFDDTTWWAEQQSWCRRAAGDTFEPSSGVKERGRAMFA
jgi:hypothetical protein